jgi:hypothetical protein
MLLVFHEWCCCTGYPVYICVGIIVYSVNHKARAEEMQERMVLTLTCPDCFENHTFCRMKFRYVCKKAPTCSSPNCHQRINGASIGNAFECHARRVRESRATGKCIFTEKAPIYLGAISQRVYDSYESGNLHPLVKYHRRSDLPFLRYDHFVAKSQIVMFVMVKLCNFASRKVNLDPRFCMIDRNIPTGEGGGHPTVNETPKV